MKTQFTNDIKIAVLTHCEKCGLSLSAFWCMELRAGSQLPWLGVARNLTVRNVFCFKKIDYRFRSQYIWYLCCGTNNNEHFDTVNGEQPALHETSTQTIFKVWLCIDLPTFVRKSSILSVYTTSIMLAPQTARCFPLQFTQRDVTQRTKRAISF